MTAPTFLTLVALVGGAVALVLVIATVTHWLQWRRATLRTRGWLVSRPASDEETAMVSARLFWYVSGQRHDGQVRLRVTELDAQESFELRVDPARPDRALSATAPPRRIAFLLSLVVLVACLLALGPAGLGRMRQISG